MESMLFRDYVADLCHRQWIGWMNYLLSKGKLNEDGSWTMPKKILAQWTKQMGIPYHALPKPVQNVYKIEADKYIILFGEE